MNIFVSLIIFCNAIDNPPTKYRPFEGKQYKEIFPATSAKISTNNSKTFLHKGHSSFKPLETISIFNATKKMIYWIFLFFVLI